MKRKFLSIALVAAVMLSSALAGCGKVAVDQQTSSPASASSDSAKGATVAAAAKKPYSDKIKIAFVPNVIGDSVATAWGDGAQKELAVFTNVTFQRFDGKASAETQVQIMQDLINQKYDAIILQCADSAALADSVKQAETAGIPVITLNLDATTPHTALIAMVDYEAGALVAKSMAKSINDEGNVVIIQATAGASRGELLESGFRDEMANHTKIKILDAQSGEWLTEKANVVMNDFLTKYKKIDGVFCHNDAMAEGASQAAEAAGRLKDIKIWGADGESKALEYIEKGKMAGTIYTNCYDQGATAARMAMYSIGAQVNASSFASTPVIKMAPIVVTSETVASISKDIRW
jgi:ribose transport system substrate-binding protein